MAVNLKDFTLPAYRSLLAGFVAFSVFFGVRALDKLETVAQIVHDIDTDVDIIKVRVGILQEAHVDMIDDIRSLQVARAVVENRLENIEDEIRIPR